jgi:hypothetical protein
VAEVVRLGDAAGTRELYTLGGGLRAPLDGDLARRLEAAP